MNRKIKLTVSFVKRTLIINVTLYGPTATQQTDDLANRLAVEDAANDGPEIAILKTFVLDRPEGWDA